MPLSLSQSRSFLQIEPQDTFTYTYNLFVPVANAPLQIFILVESEPAKPNHYTFSLSMKIGDVERGISHPVTMRLTINPRTLDFVVFAFPPRSGLPAGCLYHLRVWLRTPTADHRLFGEKDLWFGKDPEFGAIPDASFTTLRNVTNGISIYQGLVGRAVVNFVIRQKLIEPGVYALSLDYDIDGVGRTLFENYHVRFYCEPHAVSYFIYSIPVPSTPAGASHRVRVWIRTPHKTHLRTPSSPTSSSGHSNSSFYPAHTGSYLYQRLWKSDNFKIGAHLRFETIGNAIILGTRAPPSASNHDVAGPAAAVSPAVDLPRVMPLMPNRRRVSHLLRLHVSSENAEDAINDR